MSKKVCFIGNAQTNKTKICDQLMGKPINDRYIPTLGVEVYPYRTQNKLYNIWDCAGDIRYRGLRDGYYIGADIIVIFTKDGNTTYKEWYDLAKGVAPNAHIYHVHDANVDTIRAILN